MTALISALIGLLTAGVPELIEMFKRKQDHNMEIELMVVQAEIAAKQFEAEMYQAEMMVDAKQMEGIYRQAAEQKTDTWIDRLNASVRPVVTYAFVFMFFTMILAMIWQSMVMGAGFAGAMSAVFPLMETYLSATLAYWFGARILQKRRQG